MNLNRISSLHRHVITAQQNLGVNSGALAPANHDNLPRVALIVTTGRDDGLGQRHSLGPGDIRISHVADDADVRVLPFAHLGQGLLLSGRESGLGMRPGFGLRGATTRGQRHQQKPIQVFSHGHTGADFNPLQRLPAPGVEENRTPGLPRVEAA